MLKRRAFATVVALLASGALRAADPWDISDGGSNTLVLLRHGVVQSGHDLQGTPSAVDSDWSLVVTKQRHSYEARVSGYFWRDGACPAPPCGATFDRVTSAGTVVTAGVAASDDPTAPGVSFGRTIRWIDADGGPWLVRARADAGTTVGEHPYDLVYTDTTLFVPRWNNSATQSTILLLQNTTDVAVTGFVYFYSDAGSLLGTANLSVPPRGLQVLATASVPGLAGQSGSAAVAHLGGHASLVGKAVALEPATGFTFDTAITALGR